MDVSISGTTVGSAVEDPALLRGSEMLDGLFASSFSLYDFDGPSNPILGSNAFP